MPIDHAVVKEHKMKLKALLFSLILLLVSIHISSRVAFAQSQSTSGSIFYGGNAYSYKISDDDLVNTPSWNPAKEDPPLSLRKAVEIARINLRRFVKKADDLEVEATSTCSGFAFREKQNTPP